MRTAADLATDALDADEIIFSLCARPTRICTPTDQGIRCAALGMGTSIWQSERLAWKGNGGDILFDGAGKVMYNNHALGTPPSVVGPGSLHTMGGVVLSTRFCPIIPVNAFSVKWRAPCPCVGAHRFSINQCDRHRCLCSPPAGTDQFIWPRSALF